MSYAGLDLSRQRLDVAIRSMGIAPAQAPGAWRVGRLKVLLTTIGLPR